jgi:hypothetical protein
MKMLKKAVVASLVAASAFTLTSCAEDSAADVASHNLSEAAENFEVARKVKFINNETGVTEMEVVGRCNIEAEPAQLEVTCRTPSGEMKHFLGLNGSHYTVEQVDAMHVSTDHYRVTYNPSVLIPDIRVQ